MINKACLVKVAVIFLSFLVAIRFVEKGNLEVQLFILTSKLRANHQKMYTPPENKALSDINRVCTYIGVIVQPSVWLGYNHQLDKAPSQGVVLNACINVSQTYLVAGLNQRRS